MIQGQREGESSEAAPAWPRPRTPRPSDPAPSPHLPPAPRGGGAPRCPVRPADPPRPSLPLPPLAGGRPPLAGLSRSPAPGSSGPMSARLSARQPRRLGDCEPERWPRNQQLRALAERPVGGVLAPRTPARTARPAVSMGAAAVRWHLCVLLVLGARGRLAGGSGLPGKP